MVGSKEEINGRTVDWHPKLQTTYQLGWAVWNAGYPKKEFLFKVPKNRIHAVDGIYCILTRIMYIDLGNFYK